MNYNFLCFAGTIGSLKPSLAERFTAPTGVVVMVGGASAFGLLILIGVPIREGMF
jgi:hypothetical protein